MSAQIKKSLQTLPNRFANKNSPDLNLL